MCWCQTTEAEKTAAIKAAEQKIQELTSFVEEAAAKEGELKTEIAGLEEDIAADKDSLASATALRSKENEEFQTEEADMKETLSLLSQAIGVLGKVQLTQKGSAAEHQALLQVSEIVKKANPLFKSVMQKDLYDMLGGFDGLQAKPLDQKALTTGAILGEVFLPKREAAALAQSQGKSLPWIKTEEQKGMEALKPNGNS
jgi:di/tripeptidase